MRELTQKPEPVLLRYFKSSDAEGKNVIIMFLFSKSPRRPLYQQGMSLQLFVLLQCYLKFATCSFNLERTVNPLRGVVDVYAVGHCHLISPFCSTRLRVSAWDLL